MARRVVAWTAGAQDDLDAVATFIARDSARYAAAFVREVRDRARALGDLSERGRRVPELGDPGVREVFVGRYRLIYEILDDTVYVLALVHGARDLDSYWQGRDAPRGGDEL